MWVLAYHVQQVAAFHFGQADIIPTDFVSRFFLAGCNGVQLFFTISGFVLALPFAREKLSAEAKHVSLPAYYLRRVTRLEPPYIIHLFVVSVLTWLVLRKQPTRPELLFNPAWAAYASKHILASLFYSHGFIFGAYPYPNSVLWSLEVEVQFYMIAPFLAAIFLISPKLMRRVVLVGLMVGIPLLIRSTVPPEIIKRVMLLGKIEYFLGGFLLADLYLNGSLKTELTASWRTLAWDALFLIAFAGIVFPPLSLDVISPWLIVILCMAAFKGVACPRVLSNRWIATIGGMCYTIYMYHLLLISGAIRLTKPLQTHIPWLDYVIQTLIISAIVIPICALLFVVAERPFMQRHWPTKWWNKLKGSPI